MLKAFSNKGEVNAIPLNAENLNFNFTEIINMLYPIGAYFHTSNAEFNPNKVWCGTWELESDGTVLVSKSNKKDSAFNRNVDLILGEENHKLIVSELPTNIIKTTSEGNNFDGYIARGGYNPSGNYNFGGNDEAHNNIQPSKICFRWHRTA